MKAVGTENDRTTVHRILDEIEDTAQRLVCLRTDWVYLEVGNLVVAAWDEVSGLLQTARETLDQEVTGKQLRSIGMTGDELRLYESSFLAAKHHFVQHPDPTNVASVLWWSRSLLEQLESVIPELTRFRKFQEAFGKLAREAELARQDGSDLTGSGRR